MTRTRCRFVGLFAVIIMASVLVPALAHAALPTQGDTACQHLSQTLAIFEEIKSPHAEQVCRLLVELD